MFRARRLTSVQKILRRQIIETSYQRSLSHLGSCLSSVDIIESIYQVKKPNDIFVLSNGHAGIAWYVVLSHHRLLPSKKLKELSIHPDRNVKHDIHVSTGSLGQGLPIAVGMALADRSRQIYCLISDGECAEGSIWEALRIAAHLQLNNLTIVVNANGWGAYDATNLDFIEEHFRAMHLRMKKTGGHNIEALCRVLRQIKKKGAPTVIIAKTVVEHLPFLSGQSAHYYVMTEEDYQTAQKLLS